MKTILKLTLIISIIFICFSACKQDNAITKAGLHTIYSNFKNGVISECKLNEQTVYSAMENAYDASTYIYDVNGNKIGECNWAFNKVDTICYQLKNCETIYRCNNHITGQPFVDKYGLSK